MEQCLGTDKEAQQWRAKASHSSSSSRLLKICLHMFLFCLSPFSSLMFHQDLHGMCQDQLSSVSYNMATAMQLLHIERTQLRFCADIPVQGVWPVSC